MENTEKNVTAESSEKKTRKRRVLSIDMDDEMEKLLNDRIKYLQGKNPYARVTKTDAIRHALYNTSYKKSSATGSRKKSSPDK